MWIGLNTEDSLPYISLFVTATGWNQYEYLSLTQQSQLGHKWFAKHITEAKPTV